MPVFQTGYAGSIPATRSNFMTGDLHNGSAGDFGSLSEGSIPSSPANLYMSVKGLILEKL